MLGTALGRNNSMRFARALCRSKSRFLKPARWYCQKLIIEMSDSFDSDWYLANNPDIRTANAKPISHFLNYGAYEGRNPSSKFDTEYYFSMHPEILTSGLNPVVHFDLWGKYEGNLTAPAAWRSDQSSTSVSNEEIRRIRRAALGSDLAVIPAKIAIGIVTYNNSSFQIERLLRSIEVSQERLSERNTVEIFLIDNGESTKLARTFQQLYRIPSRGNIGFAAAHNILMNEAFAMPTTHYIAANPDGCFHPDCLLALLQMCQATSNLALVEALQFPDEHPKAYDPHNFDTPWSTGACLLISRAVYEITNGFDTSFFMYCEDVDLSWRVRLAGLRVKICPRALYMHHNQHSDYEMVRHGHFLLSGYLLARKWGNSLFAERMLAEMKKIGLSAEGAIVPKPVEDTLGVADFAHFFSFAPTRWT